MKSILQNIKTGEVSVEDIPSPVLKKGNILVRNICSLVSAGTEKAVLEFSNASYLKKAKMRPDLFRKVLNRAKNEGLWQTYKIVSELLEQKIQLGYSSAGKVISVGEEVNDIHVGQRVACAGLFTATHSEIVSVPRNLVTLIPEEVDYEQACFVTLGAIALQGVRLAELSLGENVVVYGLGLVGMITAQLAIAAGCRVIGLDIDREKVESVKELKCNGVLIDPDMERNVLNLTEGYGADKVLLCAATKSNDPIERIPEITRQKGVLVVIGDVPMNIPRRAYYDKEIDIKISRSYGPGRYDMSYEDGGVDYPYAYVRWTENRNMISILDLLARKRISFSELITHRFGIHEALKAYSLIDEKSNERYLGIVIRYCEDEPKDQVAKSVKYTVKQIRRSIVNFGVIGAGNFGKAFLLPAFSRVEGVRYIGICTASGVSAASVAKKYNLEFATSNTDEIFNHPEINAVMIATRHDSHAKYIIRGLEENKAIYVEKPMATTMEDLEAIRLLFEKKRINGEDPFLMVGFNRRFSPLAVILREVFSSHNEPISVIYRVNAGFVPSTEWVHDPHQGAGRVIGEGCHFIDFISFLVGEAPIAISSNALQKGGKPINDIVTLTLEFPNGSIGSIHYFANGDPGMAKEYIEVFGGKVSAQLLNFRKLKIYGAKVAGKKSYLNQVKGFEEEAEAFVSALKNGKGMPIPFEQLYATTKATLLEEEAILTGNKLEIKHG